MRDTLLIGLGGALGSMARYWVGLRALPLSRSLPWGTIGRLTARCVSLRRAAG